MSGRFPQSPSPEALWRHLAEGRELISFFSPQEMLSSGVDPDLLRDPDYVPARGFLEGVELFDAGFFGIPPREAELTDPQQRLFLECAWEAFEDAGYDPARCDGPIGLFAGAGHSGYAESWGAAVSGRRSETTLEIRLANDRDHLPTRVAYKLNLTGPAINVQTTCSTSLVALHLACQSLLCGECDLALAGGVSVVVPPKSGYLCVPEGILSPDGHCRAFDAAARGTVQGHGLGVVVLKRSAEAQSAGDRIRAVIRGSAVNNDGAAKPGYTAPSVSGQAAVIAEALAVAGVDAETVGYVETHGTGTRLGDPIEIAALSEAFGVTGRLGFCALGSIKTNMGHLDAAAGVAGLIKTVLALEHAQVPPSLHFREPNPEIDFATSPFFVNTELRPWPRSDTPRRAGVSAFGIGGTNVHVLLEEAAPRPPASPPRGEHLLLLSARTAAALETVTINLAEHLRRHRNLALADVAFTLHLGRRAFEHRRMLVCRDLEGALNALETLDASRVFTRRTTAEGPVVFLFPGQGTQSVNMGRELHEREPVFRREIDRCAEILEPHVGCDLRRLLYPPPEEQEEACVALGRTALAQPALFAVEYALARLWMEWGLQPEAMLGHSVGEYVAACLAGALELEEALPLVAARGRLIQQLPPGAMLSVPLSPQEVTSRISEELSLAAVNAPRRCVVSGPPEAVAAFETDLAAEGLPSRRLATSHAFHSRHMEPILEPFRLEMRKVRLLPPKIPFLSNVSGTWIDDAEATDPSYWTRHLCSTVRFAEGLDEVMRQERGCLLEVGPGRTLTSLARQHPASAAHLLFHSLPSGPDPAPERSFLLTTLGRLWLAGQPVDGASFYASERRHRVQLPTYPFERQRFWIEPARLELSGRSTDAAGVPAVGPESAGPEHDQDRSRPDSPEVGLRDDVARQIVELWQDLLGVEPVGTQDDFFELGGDSLLATRLLSQLRRRYGVELSLQRFAENRTIAGLARLVAAEGLRSLPAGSAITGENLEEWEL